MKKNKNRYKKKTKGIKFYQYGRYVIAIKDKHYETKGTIIHSVRTTVKEDLVLNEATPFYINHCLMIDLQKSSSFKLKKAHGRRLHWL